MTTKSSNTFLGCIVLTLLVAVVAFGVMMLTGAVR